MKKYIGVKIIEAKPMNRGEYNEYRGWTIPTDENPADEGYLVVYPDGYVSWSPKPQFEEAYRETAGGMTFGHAIEALKKGYKVSRKGWNGKGMFLYSTPGSKVPFSKMKPETQKALINHPESTVTINGHIDMKAADGTLVIGWLASQTDMLAEDWMIVK